MEKSLQTVVTATVVIMIASTLFFLISSNVGNASENQQEMVDDADCDYLQGRFELKSGFNQCEQASNIKQDASGSCDTESWGECTEESSSESGSEEEIDDRIR